MPFVITRIGVVLAIVILTAGCGSARPGPAQLTPNLTVSEKDGGGQITLEVGQFVLVRLTAGAGYKPLVEADQCELGSPCTARHPADVPRSSARTAAGGDLCWFVRFVE